MNKKLWEILVPVSYVGLGRIKKKHHKKWDRKVSKIAGGLTLFKPKKGRWLSDSKLFREKMIPVRIAATEKEMKEIATLTAKHYDQKAIMYYLISEQVVICEV
jgi:hypothetical protein